jgi:hypothetical protein
MAQALVRSYEIGFKQYIPVGLSIHVATSHHQHLPALKCFMILYQEHHLLKVDSSSLESFTSDFISSTHTDCMGEALQKTKFVT